MYPQTPTLERVSGPHTRLKQNVLTVVLQKSTPPQIRQLILCTSNITNDLTDLCGNRLQALLSKMQEAGVQVRPPPDRLRGLCRDNRLRARVGDPPTPERVSLGIQPISPYSGRDCVKSLRSSYTGLYHQSVWPAHASARASHSRVRCSLDIRGVH